MLYVVKQVPRAPRDRLMAEAAAVCVRFGEYDPADAAEAGWSVLPLGDSLDGASRLRLGAFADIFTPPALSLVARELRGRTLAG